MGPMQTLVPMLLMFAVFWFIIIRPQMKKQKEHQAMLAALDKGDTIVTRGGLIGRIAAVSGGELTIELNDKARVKVLRSHVDGKYKASDIKSTDGRVKAAA